MAEAAASWLDSLSSEQRDKATYEYMDGERVFWYYPPLNRHGLALRDMDDNQRKLAYGIMESGLTERAYKQASQIIDLETTLGKVEKDAGIVSFRRDPELYYFTVFGDPRDAENPWAWRVEGHHVSRITASGATRSSRRRRSSSARTRQRCWRDRTKGSAYSATGRTWRWSW